MTHALTAATVAELVPVATAAVATQPRPAAVRNIRRALLRDVGRDLFRACDIAAEAIVLLAEERLAAHASESAETVMPPAAGQIRLVRHVFPGQPDDVDGGPGA